MAKRVKQADGSYCYTEDCRIHDRSLSDSTGPQAAISDAKDTQRRQLSATTAEMFHKILEVNEKSSEKFADRTIDNMLGINGEPSRTMICDALQRLVREETLGAYSWHTMRTSDAIYSELRRQSVISQGDEVILNETGERGTISEGNSTFGDKIRFNSEDTHSRNSFSWFRASELTKVAADDGSLARERILAAPRDALIPAYTVREMIEQETSTRSRNPQAAREFGKSGRIAKKTLRKLGDSLEDRFEHHGVTRAHLVSVLATEYDRPNESLGLKSEEAIAVKAGLRNILSYLDSTY